MCKAHHGDENQNSFLPYFQDGCTEAKRINNIWNNKKLKKKTTIN